MKRIEPKIDVYRDAFEAYITDHAKGLGAKENADFNASQNMSIRDIDKSIESANIK